MWPLSAFRKLFQTGNPALARRSFSVVVGFAGLLILMLVLVFDSSTQRRMLLRDSNAVRKEYQQRDNLLDELRTSTYRTNSVMRDYLLESNDSTASEQRSELETLHVRTRATILAYQKLANPNEQASVRELSRNFEDYWNYLTPAMTWTAAERGHKGEAYLRDFIAPHRKDLIKLENEVNRMNERDADTEEQSIQTLQAAAQRRLTAISSFGLILAGALALGVILHVRSLERDVARRFDELQQARLDLGRLSDRLVIAQEEERRNLSRELHDDVGQSMSAMLMELGRLESKLTKDEQSRQIYASVRELAEGSVVKIRDLSLSLRPAMLDELGLFPALRWHAREVTRRTGVKVDVIADNTDDDLPDSYRTCIYRVVQEALHNCVRHSHAAEVRILLNRDQEGFTVSIADSGIGFNPNLERGLGLLGIAERVSRLGGQFHIDSLPLRGTVARVFLPMSAPAPLPAEEPVA